MNGSIILYNIKTKKNTVKTEMERDMNTLTFYEVKYNYNLPLTGGP